MSLRSFWNMMLVLLLIAAPVALAIAQDADEGDEPDPDADWEAITALLGEVNSLSRGTDEWDAKIIEIRTGCLEFVNTHGETATEDQLSNPLNLLKQTCDISGEWDDIAEAFAALTERDDFTEETATFILYVRAIALAHSGAEEEALTEALDALREANPTSADQAQGEINMLPGREAPDWTLADIHAEDEEISLSGLRGKVVLMDFWAVWCGPCKRLMSEHLAGLFEEYQDVEEFELVGIGTSWRGETADRQLQYADQMGYEWTKVYDGTGDTATAYGVRGIPFLCLVDEEGKIIVSGSGFAVIEEIKTYLAERFGNDDDDDDDEEDGSDD